MTDNITVSLDQELNAAISAPAAAGGVAPEISTLFRRAAAESCVLLKNDGTLPLGSRPVSVFGTGQVLWMDMGYGSGGDVVKHYTLSLYDALKDSGLVYNTALAEKYAAWCAEHRPEPAPWAMWPQRYEQMPLDEDTLAEAAAFGETAIVVIGRTCGESLDVKLEKGAYYLADDEVELLDAVTARFAKVVVLLNIGNIIDLAWTEKYPLAAILSVWNGGMESGTGAADILTGRVNPCGKLADTVAREYAAYPSAADFGDEKVVNYREDIFVGYRYFSTFRPEAVLYPFGFGLSYTEFKTELLSFENLTAHVRVSNAGSSAGREVVQLYCRAPQGKLGKAALSLCAFAKTPLLAAGESCELTLAADEYTLASYDDAGKTAFPYAFVLEQGDYELLFGTSSVSLELAGIYSVAETRAVKQLEQSCAPILPLERLTADGSYESAPMRAFDLKQRIIDRLPAEIPFSGSKGFTLDDVKQGKITLDEFIAQLTDDELEALTRGEGGMNSPLGAAGNAGAFGGVIPSLREKGVAPLITTDGPSGIRLQANCLLAPCAAALACTWDTALIEELMGCIGAELIERGSNMLLGPGVNIHRNPLCGRNFEYFSEDPLLTGKLGAAAIRGIQSHGGSACPKHFCCNNQELMRNMADSRISERALREIYLRPFEICINEGKPLAIMTSYNPLNGVWNHYNYDLVTTVLRSQLGFDGCVITDWWMVPAADPNFEGVRENAYRVRAQVDVFMPGNARFGDGEYCSDGTLLETLGKPEGITRAELQRSAANTLRLVMKVCK